MERGRGGGGRVSASHGLHVLLGKGEDEWEIAGDGTTERERGDASAHRQSHGMSVPVGGEGPQGGGIGERVAARMLLLE